MVAAGGGIDETDRIGRAVGDGHKVLQRMQSRVFPSWLRQWTRENRSLKRKTHKEDLQESVSVLNTELFAKSERCVYVC